MHCLLISATAFEIAPFIETYRKYNGNFIDGVEINILISGIGLVASTYNITKHLMVNKPDVIVQAGVGGSFDKNISLGSVVAVRQERVADLGVFENKKWKTLDEMGLEKAGRFPYSNGWLVNRSPLMKTVKLPKVKGISVNEITTSPGRIKILREKFNPTAESLEGAALHYVAISEKIPFIQIRALSNYIGERDKGKWQMKEAITNLNHELKKILQSLNPL